MKKFFCTFFLCMLTAVTLTVSARAGEDIIKVGLYYGDKALYSANLQNDAGSGYALPGSLAGLTKIAGSFRRSAIWRMKRSP